VKNRGPLPPVPKQHRVAKVPRLFKPWGCIIIVDG
jgi:hypothetical protein